MRHRGPALVLVILLSIGLANPAQTPTPQTQATTQTPTEPPAPRPSAAVDQILRERSPLTDKIAAEKRQPTPSEQVELSKFTEEKLERALTLARVTGDAAGEASVLRSKCTRYLFSADFGKGVGRAEVANHCLEAAAAWKRAGHGPGQCEALGLAAFALLEEKPAEAKKLAAEAIETCKAETLRPLAASMMLDNLTLRFSLKQKDLALAFAEAALDMGERIAPVSLGVARILQRISGLYGARGDLDARDEFAQRALATLEGLPPETKKSEEFSRNMRQLLQNLGVSAIQRGSGAEARKYLVRCLELQMEAEQARRPDSGGSHLTFMHLGIATVLEGDYTMAVEYFRRGVQLLEKAPRPELPINAVPFYTNLAEHEVDVGDVEAAKADYQRALALLEKAQLDSRNRPEQVSEFLAVTFTGLGRVAELEGNAQQANDYRNRAIAVYEKLPARDMLHEASILARVGKLLRANGNLSASEAYSRRALPVYEKAYPAGDRLAGLLDELGWLALERADWPAARELFQRALAIEEKALGPNHPYIAETLRGLAKATAGTGAPREALDLALNSEQTRLEHLQLAVQSLPERQALLLASTRSSATGTMLALASGPLQETAKGRQQVFDVVIRSRAMVLDEMASRHRAIGETGDPEIAQLAQDLAAKRKLLAMLVVRGPGDDLGDRYRGQVEEYRRAKEEAERKLAAKSAVFRREQARARVGLDEVAAALPRGSALVAFVRHSRETGGQKDPLAAREVYSAFVLKSDQSEPELVSLGTAEEIEGLAARWREQIREQAGSEGQSAKQLERDYRSVGAELRKRVWDPVASSVKGATRIFVVPDGALHLVNFAALPAGESRYLIESGPPIHYLSAERDLVRLPGQEARGRGLVALGAPAFDETRLFAALAPPGTPREKGETKQAVAPVFRGARSACGDFQSLRFESLPASEQELREVTAIWRRQSSQPAKAQLGGAGAPDPARQDVLLLSGATASEASLKENAPHRRILHLATHGFFLGDRCPAALTQAETTQRGAAPAPARGENPLLLAGLAFAGANRRQSAGPEEEDGILTAEEIASLDLNGVEWAVLSACDTGAGELRAGEGVLGLRRAFQIAGVQTLVMSLWQVEDQSTRAWMKALYEQRFLRHQASADAAHLATLESLRQRRAKGQSTHPFFWAGFVAAGDWR